LNFNGKKFLNKCLDSVLKSDYPNFEVILVDNASTDGNIKLVKKGFCQHSNSKKNCVIRLGKELKSILVGLVWGELNVESLSMLQEF
jgi:glycosyltransferase involved in cell wall biosynthesis